MEIESLHLRMFCERKSKTNHFWVIQCRTGVLAFFAFSGGGEFPSPFRPPPCNN